MLTTCGCPILQHLAPLALVLLYAALIGVLCLSGLARSYAYLEVVPSRGTQQRMRGTVWEYVGWNTAPLSWRQVMLHGNSWTEGLTLPGLDLLSRWSRHIVQPDDQLLARFDQAMALRLDRRDYDSLLFFESFEIGPYELVLHHGDDKEHYFFIPPGQLGSYER